MKKLIGFLSLISVFFISLFLILSKIVAEKEEWRNWGKENDFKILYLDLNEKSNEDLYKVLTKSAIDNKINFIKTNFPYSSDGKEQIIKSIFLGNRDLDIFFNKPDILKKFFKIDKMEENFFISTKEKPESSGKIFDFLDQNDVEIQTFKRLLDSQKSLKGEYIVRYSKLEEFHNFINELSKKLNIPEDKLTTKKTFENIERSPIAFLGILGLVISLIFLVLTAIFYSIKNLKLVGIKKLFGYSFSKIFVDLFGFIFLTTIFTSCFFDFGFYIFFKNITRDFFISLLLGQLLVIFLILISTIPAIIIVKKYKISNLLSNKNPTKMVCKLIFAIKQLLLVVLVVASCTLPGIFREIGDIINRTHKWEKVKDFATIESYSIGDNLEDVSMQNPNLNIKIAKLFEFLEKKYKDCLYLNQYDFEPYKAFPDKQDVSKFKDEVIKTISVNTNYLKKYDIIGIDNKKITVENDENCRVILIPKSSKINQDEIQNLYFYRTEKNIDFVKDVYKIDYEKEIKIKSLFYDDTNTNFFTFNRSEENSNDFIKSPFIEVIPTKLMTLIEKGDRGTGKNCSLKIDLNNKETAEFLNEIQLFIKELDLEKNKLEFKKYGEIFNDEIEAMRNGLKIAFFVIFLLFLIIILLSMQNIKIYLETYKREISIKKIHGIKVRDIYSRAIISSGLSSLLIVLISLYFAIYKNSTATKDATNLQIYRIDDILFVCFSIIFLDFFVSFLFVRFYELKKVQNLIKGSP